MVELGREEALKLLGTVHVGRVAFTEQALPVIRPSTTSSTATSSSGGEHPAGDRQRLSAGGSHGFLTRPSARNHGRRSGSGSPERRFATGSGPWLMPTGRADVQKLPFITADARQILRESLDDTSVRARGLRRTVRAPIEENQRLLDRNDQLRHRHACIVEISRALPPGARPRQIGRSQRENANRVSARLCHADRPTGR
ncbi:pyridoxamine 5'-phosphate oxidase family protein [Streptomyces sp. GbtcB6]|uniref:pyridoxamine 5'-phosphate oxidase family protein n=1 Tax=Streptomyces sp. GbtcB6 TaxID=2824751 RepID=UPI001C30D785|nr:pyridoxamine 5'-phosphate oxidase family protein [Streptomyces sp. GbtcB6]